MPVAQSTSIIFLSILPSKICVLIYFITFPSVLVHRVHVFCHHTESKDEVIKQLLWDSNFSPNREDVTLSEHQMGKDVAEFLIKLIC